eukprot:4842094-Pyramimonas_sp.AAC.1
MFHRCNLRSASPQWQLRCPVGLDRAPDWSIVRIYPRFLHLIGPLRRRCAPPGATWSAPG